MRWIFLCLAVIPAFATSADWKICYPPTRLNLAMGVFGVHNTETQALISAEWRYPWERKKFRFFSSFFLTQKASFYLCTGFCWDLLFCHKIVIVPSFAPGLYIKGGGKDLGCLLEFRTGLELGYQFSNKTRLTFQYYHISNAKIGTINPGSEIIAINYSFNL